MTQDIDDLEPGRGIALEERQDVATIQDSQRACALRDRICRSLLAVEDGKLAEHFARMNDGKQQFFAVVGRNADAYGPAEDSHDLVARGADREDTLAGIEGPY